MASIQAMKRHIKYKSPMERISMRMNQELQNTLQQMDKSQVNEKQLDIIQ